METMKLIAPCHFGVEAVLKKEIYDLGYEIESGIIKIPFAITAENRAKINVIPQVPVTEAICVKRFHL